MALVVMRIVQNVNYLVQDKMQSQNFLLFLIHK